MNQADLESRNKNPTQMFQLSPLCFPAEFLFLLWGVYLCYAVRAVPSAFHEPRYMAAAIYNELLCSAVFHIIRSVENPPICSSVTGENNKPEPDSCCSV